LTEEAKLHLPELGEEESDIILHLALSITQDRLGIIFHQLEMHTTVYNVYNTLHPIFTMHSHPIIIAKDLHSSPFLQQHTNAKYGKNGGRKHRQKSKKAYGYSSIGPCTEGTKSKA
jgi:hypothetical protein